MLRRTLQEAVKRARQPFRTNPTSPSEELLREYRSGGLPRLLKIARL